MFCHFVCRVGTRAPLPVIAHKTREKRGVGYVPVASGVLRVRKHTKTCTPRLRVLLRRSGLPDAA